MKCHLPIALLLTFILTSKVLAASVSPGALFTYEGVLTDTNGVAITTSQNVTLQILYPPSCILLEETHTINPGSVGEFSVIVGSGLRADSTNNGAEKIFATSGSVSCTDGSTATVTGTPRSLRVKVNSTTLSPDVTITNVPFAINASRLSDKAVTDFVQISANTTQSRVEDVFTRYTALDAALNIFSIAPGAGQLLGGNGGVYAPISLVGGAGINITHSLGSITIASTGGGGNVVAVTAQPPLSVGGSASNPDIALSQAGVSTHGYLSSDDWNIFNNKLGTALSSGKIFVGSAGNLASAVNLSGDATLNSSGNLTLINVGTPGTYAKVTTDAKGRVTGGSDLTAADIPTLDWTKITGFPTTLAGYGITDAVSKAGDTMTGALNLGGNDLLNAGHVVMGTQKTLKLGNYSSAQEGTLATSLNGSHIGYTWYNSSTNEIRYWNGSAVVSLGIAGGGITSLNGLTSPAQSFNFDSTGTDVSFSSSGAIHTFHFPTASATARGFLSSGDWTNFNNKLSSSVAFGGDVSGTFSSISVEKIKGRAISGTTPAVGNFLRYNGTEWTPVNLNTDINADTNGTLSVGRGGTGATAFAPNRMIASNGSGNAFTDFSCGVGTLPSFDVMGVLGCYSMPGLGILMNGGNANGAPIHMGTNDSQSLYFKSNGNIRMAIDPGGRVGLGTQFPTAPLEIVSEGINGTLVNRTHSDTAVQGSLFLGARTRGSSGAPTLVQDGDAISEFSGTSEFGSAARSGIRVTASEAHTGSAKGLNLEFWVTPNSTVNRKRAMILRDNGNLGLGNIDNNAIGFFAGLPAIASQRILEITGEKTSPEIYSNGALMLSNNRPVETMGDELGSIMFAHKSGTYGLYSRIRSDIEGSVTGNRGGSLTFLTKADGVNSLTAHMRITSTGFIGIGTISPAYKLDVQGGDIRTTGNVHTVSVINTSDRRFKDNIQLIPDALKKILHLQGVTYDWKRAEFPERQFSSKKQMGVIAQEVESQFPEAVETDSAGYKSVNYASLVAPLIESTKTLHGMCQASSAEIKILRREIAGLYDQNAEKEIRLQRLEEENRNLKKDLEMIKAKLGLQ